MFIDIHCHLDMCKNLLKTIENAKQNNVGLILTNGVNQESNKKSLILSKKFDIVKPALGLYPLDGLKMTKKGVDLEIEFIKKNKKELLAIGEVGLDFKDTIHPEDKKIQEEIFIKLINLSKEVDKPLIVHSRKAEEECINLLETYIVRKVVMHCFSGKKKLINRIIENGWFLSIPSSVNYNKQFQDIVKDTPISSLLTETDSPFLHPFKEKDNEPINVIHSYKTISKIKGISLKQAEEIISDNINKLF